jgi:sporulation protein YlmC with PRC-barrel domain
VRLSDIVGAEVRDRSDRAIGVVTDVRLVQDYPVLGDLGAAFRIECLIVGGNRALAHTGLIHGRIRGPRLLKAVARALRGKDRAIPWDRVRAIEHQRVRIDATLDELSFAYR